MERRMDLFLLVIITWSEKGREDDEMWDQFTFFGKCWKYHLIITEFWASIQTKTIFLKFSVESLNHHIVLSQNFCE